MNHFSSYEDMKRQLFYSKQEEGTGDTGCYVGGKESGVMTPQNGVSPRSGGVPVTPIAPEGSMPVAPGPDGDMSNVPTTPIAPEGSMPVAPGPDGDMSNIPTTPIAPEGSMPVAPGPGGDISNIPTTPIAPEGSMPVAPGPGVTILPPVVINYATVRVFHAASNFVPLRVTIGNRTLTNDLAFGKVSGYSRITDGFRIVTVYSTVSNEVLLRVTLPFTSGQKITLAIINTANGLEIVTVSDTACRNIMNNRGCLRAANLTFDDGPFDIILSDGRMVFSDVRQKEVTSWKQAVPGDYEFYIMETPYGVMPIDTMGRLEEMPYITQGRYVDASYLLNFYVRVNAKNMYTAYIIGGYYSVTPLQVVVIED